MGSYSYFPEAFTSISTGHLEFHNIFVVTLRKKRQENHMLIGAPSSTTVFWHQPSYAKKGFWWSNLYINGQLLSVSMDMSP